MPDDKNSLKKIQELFQASLELEPEERKRFLEEVCGEDPELKAQLEKLLGAHESQESFLDSNPVDRLLEKISDLSTVSVEQSLVGVRIGNYKVVRLIASGGMGTVYEAIQEHPRRKIALKVLRSTLISPEALNRFEQEWQILALLRHPGIAQIYDAGLHTDDRGAENLPYFAMELVQGESLQEYLRNHKPGIRERLEIFSKVCDAVQHAHQKGVIHRDIKPGNIFLDTEGEPKVLDFGIARSPLSDLTSTTLKADAEFLLGTLPYMSPEQTEGDSTSLDTRSDVYSLGVVLYELLTGRLPYDLSEKTGTEVIRVIRSMEATPPGTVNRSLRGDLETIILKTLQKQKSRRYSSAGDLAADIRRHLKGEPILARAPSVAYQALKVLKKHKVPAILACLMVILVSVFALVVSVQLTRVADLEEAIHEARQNEEQALLAAENAREELRQAETLEQEAGIQTARLDYAARIAAANNALHHNHVNEAGASLQKAHPDERGWEWYYLQSNLDQSLETLFSGNEKVWSTRFSRDGRFLASADDQGRIRIWDFEERKIHVIKEKSHQGEIRALDFGPRDLIASGGLNDFVVKVWQVSAAGLELLSSLEGHTGDIEDVAMSPDGKRIISTSMDRTARIWDWEEKRVLHILKHPWTVFDVDISPDGQEVVTSCRDNRIRIWDATSGKLLERIEAMPLESKDFFKHRWPVVFARSGQLIAAGCHRGEVKVWDRGSLEILVTLWGHEAGVWSLDSDPAGNRLVSCSHDRTLRLWEIDTGREPHCFRGHSHSVYGVAFHTSGTAIASGSRDGSVKVWDPELSGTPRVLIGHVGEINSLALDPEGKWVATGGNQGTIHTWDAATLEMAARLTGHRRAVGDLDFSPMGDRLVSASEDRTVRIWNPQTGEELMLLQGHGDQVLSVAFHPKRQILASGCKDGIVKFWSSRTGHSIKSFRAHTHSTECLRFSPDGKLLATGSGYGTIRLWDAYSGQELKSIPGTASAVFCLAFSPEDSRIAAGLNGGKIQVWEVSTGELALEWEGHQEMTFSVTFSPDGHRLVSSGGDSVVRLWDSRTGEPLLHVHGHRSWIFGAAFDRAGRRLYSGGSDKTLRVWDTALPGERIPPLREVLNRKNRVRPLVDRLFEEALVLSEVLKRLDEDTTLDATSRLTARRLAIARGDDPWRLNRESWEVVSQADRSDAEYRLALKKAQAACQLYKDYGTYLNTQGVAWYRLGDYEKARDVLERSDGLNRRGGRKGLPEDSAFLAMTYWKLGEKEKALAAFERLRELMELMNDPEDLERRRFLEEVTKLLGIQSKSTGEKQ